MQEDLDTFDAVIVGGGSAGLSAALALGRATRRVLVSSCGPTRNAPATHAHNIFTRDGTPPAELVRIGRDQLQPYHVTFADQCAEDARREAGHYIVTLSGGREVRARGIVLANGVRDILPEVPGMRELWGTSVYHCPYCHGWEVARRPLGIYARGEAALHLTKLLRVWTDDLVLFTDGDAELPDEEVNRIRNNGVVVRRDRVERLTGGRALEAVVMENGDVIHRAGLFVSPKQEQRSDLYKRLGCALSDTGRIQGDAAGRTNVPRVFVAGDAGPGAQSVISAAATGMLAGAGLNLDLATEDFH